MDIKDKYDPFVSVNGNGITNDKDFSGIKVPVVKKLVLDDIKNAAKNYQNCKSRAVPIYYNGQRHVGSPIQLY